MLIIFSAVTRLSAKVAVFPVKNSFEGIKPLLAYLTEIDQIAGIVTQKTEKAKGRPYGLPFAFL
ncbi:hypothetical protein A2837_03365 [Candidatus Kaiserbacteria bacterium RIFCSPHIGHO2_01_FULL_46_22]|uniref:Uncharacterized protein n=1 Tax=Candidatus Kaiserbacteria bacterium RIFCSPHIGHO2_01_FULL_46_22 TaxID=1798475 RepID=A0A1F6BXH2_9BACT|nr:MAG: hypothetical protein A2837_03365 [Candidatus Kaiserbacteria bacterium RIFCSPHIGHO2_01_FULL_46_22]